MLPQTGFADGHHACVPCKDALRSAADIPDDVDVGHKAAATSSDVTWGWPSTMLDTLSFLLCHRTPADGQITLQFKKAVTWTASVVDAGPDCVAA
eukprot:3232629-Amphidinium_carterae.1